jgi:hypothetical protein
MQGSAKCTPLHPSTVKPSATTTSIPTINTTTIATSTTPTTTYHFAKLQGSFSLQVEVQSSQWT